MISIQLSIFFVIFLLLFNKESRVDAFILFAAYSVYMVFTFYLPAISEDGFYKYSITAGLNLTVGFLLHQRNVHAAICSYTLVIVNLIGFCIWYLHLPLTDYNNFSLAVLIIQLITITPKGLTNGLRRYSECITAKFIGRDSIQTHTTLRENQKGGQP